MNGQLQQPQSSGKWFGAGTKHYIALVAAFVGLSAVIVWKWSRSRDMILAYSVHDREALEHIFYDNEFLLLAEGSTHFSLSHMFENFAPSYEYPNGSLTIKVAHYNGKPAGFVTYHRKNAVEGRIQFLVTDKAVRGKGVGKALLQHAIDDLRKRGFQYVILSVRVENLPAQSLYRSFGFEEQSSSGGFLELSKRLRGADEHTSAPVIPEW